MKNKTNIAMRCNQEQWELLKPKVSHFDIKLAIGFSESSYITNNFCGEFGILASLYEGSGYKRQVHEEFNEKIFLEACGISVFEITKETVIKYQMKDEFPEVFSVELVVGKWYKRPHNKALFKVLSRPEENGKFNIYGFDARGFWMKSEKCYTWPDQEIEATTKEVTEALKNEALKRYKVGDYIDNSNLKDEDFGEGNKIEGRFRVGNNYTVWCDSTDGYNRQLFKNGIWATVIPTKTIQEAEELLNCKIV